MEQKPSESPDPKDLFPKAPADEKGFRLNTWGGYEVVLPESLVTPNMDYAQTAPPAGPARKRRAQRRKPRRARAAAEQAGGNTPYAHADAYRNVTATATYTRGFGQNTQDAEQPASSMMNWKSALMLIGIQALTALLTNVLPAISFEPGGPDGLLGMTTIVTAAIATMYYKMKA